MGEYLTKSYAPGAVVTVVQGDHILFSKGYGFANAETHATIDPEKTLFRIASITKLVTAAATLRLAEDGRINLDADVNRYLTRVKVPTTFPSPVTARGLLTHHGGFESAVGYLLVADQGKAPETPEELGWDLIRTRPVTAIPSYDNLGFGVLGLVIADAMGTSYAEIIRQEIFGPLGMTRSVVGLPSDRAADVAQAHLRGSDWHAKVIPNKVLRTSGQGGGDISATGSDVGRFMSGLLVPGLLLQPASLAKMTDFDTWRLNPRLPGLGLALWQYRYHGHDGEGHRGEIDGFISRLALFREQRIGIFVSIDSSVQIWPEPRLSDLLTHAHSGTPPPGARTLDPDGVIDGLIERFADHFLPAPRPVAMTAAPRDPTEPGVNDLAGVYFRRDLSSHLMARLLATVSALRLVPMAGERFSLAGCSPFSRVAPLYYECKPPTGELVRLGFRKETDGRIYFGNGPVGALERQPWWLTAPITVLPIPLLTLFNLSTLLAFTRSRNPSRRRILKMIAAGTLAFLVGLLCELQFAYDLAHSAPHWLPILWRLLFTGAAVLLLLSAATALRQSFVLRRDGPRVGLAVSIYLVTLAISSLGLVWLMLIWSLLWPFR